MTRYELRRHYPSGELFGLKYDGEQLAGVSGPLHHREANSDITECEYDIEDAEWAESQQWQTPIRTVYS